MLESKRLYIGIMAVRATKFSFKNKEQRHEKCHFLYVRLCFRFFP